MHNAHATGCRRHSGTRQRQEETVVSLRRYYVQYRYVLAWYFTYWYSLQTATDGAVRLSLSLPHVGAIDVYVQHEVS
jgi:hypothetical protein